MLSEKEFVEQGTGKLSLDVAKRQQKQLSYFLTSEVQEDVRYDYFEKFANSKHYTNDVFLNWVKSVLKHKNFLTFAKYFRNPNPSSRLINTRIKEPLSRVFFSEDSYFTYKVGNENIDFPEELDDDFEQKLFNAILFRHNDVIIHDLSDVNEPFRRILEIEKVTSIEVKDDCIERIAYTAYVQIGDKMEPGYIYIDDKKYQFYNASYDLLLTEPHDYGRCPATFVVQRYFDLDPIVKESIFSYLRGDLEEYNFLKTLERMSNANGVLPIVTQLDTTDVKEDGEDFKVGPGEPMSLDQIGGQVSKEARATAGIGEGTDLQPGTVVKVPIVEKDNGAIDMELVKNYFNFYNTPTEALEYLNKRINELENKIIIDAIGDYQERNEASMTELQVAKGFVSREDKLRWLSSTMSFARGKSDDMMLSLKYGKGMITVDVFYGSDFFMETQAKLYEMFKNSPNAIERKNILIRLSQRRNMFNKEKSKKEVILYKLMPYASDKDFELAVNNQKVSDILFELQTRFAYWIARFEATYGSIVSFWDSSPTSESETIIMLNNLIYNLIQNETEFETDPEAEAV